MHRNKAQNLIEKNENLILDSEQNKSFQEKFIVFFLLPIGSSIVGGLFVFILGYAYLGSIETNYNLSNFTNELQFNIRQLQTTDNVLKSFEEYFNEKFSLIVKKRKINHFPVFPIWMTSTNYFIEPINKDDPIWIFLKNTTYKPHLRSNLFRSLSSKGIIYGAINDGEIESLDKMDTELQPKIFSLIEEVITELKSFYERPKLSGNKQKAEEYKNSLENLKNKILNKIKLVRSEINQTINHLGEIVQEIEKSTNN